MAPILELIKQNAVPVNVMRSASKGALPLEADEMLAVLVYLAQHPLFGQDARMTLARWDALSAREVLAKDTTPADVLLYFWQEQNRRPGLMLTLIENPAIPEGLLMELAGAGSREMVTLLLASERARSSPGVVEALTSNQYLTPLEAHALQGGNATGGTPPASAEDTGQDESLEEFEVSPEVEAAHQAFHQEHAAEIAAEEGKPFELTKEEEEDPLQTPGVVGNSAETPAAEAVAAPAIGEFNAVEQKKLTALQRIAKMNVGQRIKLGFIGGKDERAILVRDTARLVQNAVLSSPKLSDAEVEGFAGSKNLQENVFREIARQRRFMKIYPVIRNLVGNPKCPLDISLTLVKGLMVQDLKGLRTNKNVPDTIRKVAAKLYLEKASRGGSKAE
jgi:hypothetical protein